MATYIVRLINKPRELVYFGAAESIQNLFWTVDEAADPCDCEYAVVNDGGLCWLNAGTGVLFGGKDDDSEPENLAGASFTEALSLSLYAPDRLNRLTWRKMKGSYAKVSGL